LPSRRSIVVLPAWARVLRGGLLDHFCVCLICPLPVAVIIVVQLFIGAQKRWLTAQEL
jgi:hypothetical protein